MTEEINIEPEKREIVLITGAHVLGEVADDSNPEYLILKFPVFLQPNGNCMPFSFERPDETFQFARMLITKYMSSIDFPNLTKVHNDLYEQFQSSKTKQQMGIEVVGPGGMPRPDPRKSFHVIK